MEPPPAAVTAPATHRCPLDPAVTHAGGRSLGQLGEDLAAEHLRADGLEIVARNWRLTAGERRGELDLAPADASGGCVVICEVKTRRDAQRFGGALSAIAPRKAAKIRALSVAFLREAQLAYPRVRLDAIAVDLGREPVLHHVLAAL